MSMGMPVNQSPAAAALTAAGVPPAAAAGAALASGAGQQAAEKPKQVKMTALLGSISAQLRGQAPALGEASDAYVAERQPFDGEFGDRRQEVVFIGVRMDKAAITALLDACLLTDTEMDSYKQHWNRGDDA